MTEIRSIVFILCAGALAAVACQAEPDATAPSGIAEARGAEAQTRVLDTDALADMESLLDAIADRRVVFVGETHDRYEDHLSQVAILDGLHRRGRALAIGLEAFQQPFQGALDAYVAGEIDEAELLRRTEYFDRWRFDYRLYRPILHFAREHRIPLVALNLEAELTSKVGEGGIASLSEEERARIPAEIDRGDPAYRERVKAVFDMHPVRDQGGDRTKQADAFERFIEVQLLWDEGMAERAARYLADHPDRSLVVIAGGGHVEYGQGIPKRVLRRVPVPAATVLNGNGRTVDPDLADFLLFPRRVDLPPAGMLGVMLAPNVDASGAKIDGFSEGSGAQAAGIEKGDRIVSIGGRTVASYADVRLAMIDRRPGERTPVEILRKRVLGGEERMSFEVELR